MKRKMFAAAPVVALLLLMAGAQRALADTWYCTASNCDATAPSSGAYWTVVDTMTLNTTLSTFDFKLSITGVNGALGFMQDFSGQFFFGGSASVTNLAWVSNPGSWTDLQQSKAGNNGSCNGNTSGAFCAAVDTGGTRVALGSTAQVFEITGSYAGTFLDSNGDYHLQMAASNNSDGSNGNAFAISEDFSPSTGQVPDGGVTVMLLGGALVGLEALRRKVRV